MRKYVRFLIGLRKFAKARIEPHEAIARARILLRERLAEREENFLHFVEKGIFNYAKSPYLPLLTACKISLNDLKSWIARDGLEGALLTLQAAGVYFTVDEFKGKTPVKRNGATFACNGTMFDNPFLRCAYEVRSGATRSAGTRIRIDFDYLDQRSLYDAFLLDLHGCLTAPVANWFPIFPGAPGINSSLRFAHIGNPVRRWFSQVAEDQVHVNWEKRVGTKTIFAVQRLSGAPLAEPEYVSLLDARRVATWAAEALQEDEHCVVYTFASSAVRVCNAAVELNLNLKGAKFFVTGEPLTEHRKNDILAAGASAVPVYGISEAGVIAAGCDQAHPVADHCHLFTDTTAVIRHQQIVPNFDTYVNAYLFTTLLYESPKLLLNVGMGDFGELSSQPCNCPFGEIGFHTALSRISSYEKLTGEGVTLVDLDVAQIIEKDLPDTFGGKSTDYQLVEEEKTDGFTNLHLLVSPQLGSINEIEILERFMTLLQHSKNNPEWAQSGVEMWRQAGMVQIRRDHPVATKSGKILPFHLKKTPGNAVATGTK